jgi:hypothetical protein
MRRLTRQESEEWIRTRESWPVGPSYECSPELPESYRKRGATGGAPAEMCFVRGRAATMVAWVLGRP